MPGVEFLDGDDGDDGSGGAWPGRPVEPGPPRRRRPRLLLAGLLVLLAGIAVVVVRSHGGSSRPEARPSPPPFLTPTPQLVQPGPMVPGPGLVVPRRRDYHDGAVIDLAAAEGRLYGVTARSLYLDSVASANGQADDISVDATAFSRAPGSRPHIIVDGADERVWLVALHGTAVALYDPFSLTLLVQARAPAPIIAADAAAGTIFVATTRGLYAYAPDLSAPVRLTRAAVTGVYADPARQRVLTTENRGAGTLVRAWTRHGGQPAHVTVALRQANLAAMGDRIWVAGRLQHGVGLVRLDAALHQQGPIDVSLSAAATNGRLTLVPAPAAADYVVVRAGTSALVCLSTGEQAPRYAVFFSVPGGPITLFADNALVATGTGVVAQPVDACAA